MTFPRPRTASLALGLAGLAACLGPFRVEAAADRPNVVMIISDDHAYTDFGFMGHPLVETPHVDRLASQSARYVNGYVPSSVCRPSLATLLTGLYPHQHGIHFNHPPPGYAALSRMKHDDYDAARARAEGLIASVPALPRILAERGYDCLQTGKYWEGHFRTAGFTHGMTTGRAAGVDGCWDKELPDGTTVAHGNGDAGLIIGRSTMQPLFDFIDGHARPGDRPFLIWYAPVLPHEPHNPPDQYLAKYRDRPEVPPHCVAYYANCTWFDDTVGALIGYLERKGLAKNTLFVFVADNGWAPSPQAKSGAFPVDRRSKRSPFDMGLRTPILVRWDGRVEPATHRGLVGSVDVVPTILDALGLGQHAAAMAGESLMPSAAGEEPLRDRPVFGEVYPGDASCLGRPERDVAYRWIRQGRWKLIVPHDQGRNKPWGDYLSGAALFDVVDDPHESTDRSRDPQCAGEVARLRAMLDAWWNPGEPF